jgi:hypothetical protein
VLYIWICYIASHTLLLCFLVYLVIPYQLHWLYNLKMVRWFYTMKWEGSCYGLPNNYQEGLGKPMKICHNSQSLGWDLNVISTKYEAWVAISIWSVTIATDKKYSIKVLWVTQENSTDLGSQDPSKRLSNKIAAKIWYFKIEKTLFWSVVGFCMLVDSIFCYFLFSAKVSATLLSNRQ